MIKTVRLNQRRRSINHTASCIKGHPDPVLRRAHELQSTVGDLLHHSRTDEGTEVSRWAQKPL